MSDSISERRSGGGIHYVNRERVEFEFGIARPTRVFDLGIATASQITDVLVTISGSPPEDADRFRGASPCAEDVRLYVGRQPGGRDPLEITEPFIHAIRSGLDEKPISQVRREYSLAAEAWLERRKELGLPTAEGQEANDRDSLAAVLSTVPFSESLDRLGNRACGWRGLLHPFNFLWSNIAIPPISLAEVLRRSGGGPNLAELSLVVSHGPIANRTLGGKGVPAGGVAMTLTTVMPNALYPIVMDWISTVGQQLGAIEVALRVEGPLGSTAKAAREFAKSVDIATRDISKVLFQEACDLQELARQVALLQQKVDTL
jgi:hypothetical protein